MTTLTERRKADRLTMARCVRALAESYGIPCELRELGKGREHRIYAYVEGTIRVTLDFSARSCQPDVHVIPWNIGKAPPAPYLAPEVFDRSVNQFHGAKATLVRYGWDELYAHLDAIFAAVREGRAFTHETPPCARHALRLSPQPHEVQP